MIGTSNVSQETVDYLNKLYSTHGVEVIDVMFNHDKNRLEYKTVHKSDKIFGSSYFPKNNGNSY